MKPNTIYAWEMETADGQVLKQYEADGTENTWKQLDVNEVVRVSFISGIAVLPAHNIFINREKGERFVRRFGRGFIKQSPEGFQLAGYLNCAVTNRYRFYCLHSGQCFVTDPDYELYL